MADDGRWGGGVGAPGDGGFRFDPLGFGLGRRGFARQLFERGVRGLAGGRERQAWEERDGERGRDRWDGDDLGPYAETADPNIVCPILGALVRAGVLDPKGRNGFVKLWSVYGALRQLHASPAFVLSLVGIAPIGGNGLLRAPLNLLRGGFSLRLLGKGFLKHPTDTGVRSRGPFDPHMWDRLISFSADGASLTTHDVAAEIRGAYQRAPSWHGRLMSVIELGAILQMFGEPTADGDLAIPIERLEALYRHETLPADWRPIREVGYIQLIPVYKRLFDLMNAMEGGPAASGEPRGATT